MIDHIPTGDLPFLVIEESAARTTTAPITAWVISATFPYLSSLSFCSWAVSSDCELPKSVSTVQLVFPVPDVVWPAGHVVHVVAPVEEANVSAGQSVQFVLPTPSVYVPAGQSVQVELPAPDENWPAGHEVQVEVPKLEANVPAAQSKQLELPVPDA